MVIRKSVDQDLHRLQMAFLGSDEERIRAIDYLLVDVCMGFDQGLHDFKVTSLGGDTKGSGAVCGRCVVTCMSINENLVKKTHTRQYNKIRMSDPVDG